MISQQDAAFSGKEALEQMLQGEPPDYLLLHPEASYQVPSWLWLVRVIKNRRKSLLSGMLVIGKDNVSAHLSHHIETHAIHKD